MSIADCQHENYEEYMDGSGVCLAGLRPSARRARGRGMSRDAVCIALSQLHGHDPRSWDGLAVAELWQRLTDEQMTSVCEHLGIA
jgi:hypothetical protein